MSKDLVISDLSDVQDWLDTVANWHYFEWAKREAALEARTPSEMIKRQNNLKSHLASGSIPSTFILHDGTQPYGSVSLVNYNFTRAEKESTWLTNLYVIPAQRTRGFGSILLNHAVEFADKLHVPQLRLYTHDQEGFYAKRGWKTQSYHTIQGDSCSIMIFSN